MISATLQLFLMGFCVVVILSTMAFAMYCRQRSKAFIGTGRITDIEAWALRANLSWVFCAVITTILFAAYTAI